MYYFFVGLAMGFVELVPGISGGTVAFLSGIYEELLIGISSFHPRNFIPLFKGQWKVFNKTVHWRFMSTLLFGMFFSVMLMARLIHTLLNDPTMRSYLSAFFFGLILASCYLCYRRIRIWNTKTILWFLGGIILSLVIALQGLHTQGERGFDFFLPDFFLTHFFWLRGSLILAGMVGIVAMLLPGISGSYVLALLGLYPMMIASLAHPLQTESLIILGNLAFGIITGSLLFSHTIRRLLIDYPSYTVGTLTGFIIGSILPLWPFWSYKTVSNSSLHVALIPLKPYLPSLTEPHTWGILTTIALAAAIALALEAAFLKTGGGDLPHDKLHDANTTRPPGQ